MMRAGLRILLAEDDDADALLARQVFARDLPGARIDVARDGEEVLEYLRGQGKFAGCTPPDVVLLDLHMPGTDGFEALAQIRKDPQIKDTPVIVLTGSGDANDIERTFQLAADAYLTKPLGVVAFLHTLDSLHEARPEQRPLLTI